jgi:drug/metabolite transporter (DMT)-like permease
VIADLVVLARIVANPVSNLFQKQLTQRPAHPLLIIGVTHALLTLLCLPTWYWISWPVGAQFWANMLLSAALAVASNVLLVFALRSSDLSVLGPLNAYKPVVGIIAAIFLVGEIPSLPGVAGVGLIVAGSAFVVDRPSRVGWGVQLRLAALVLSATEAVYLKKALLVSTPLTVFVFWSMLGVPMAGFALLLFRERVARGRLDRTYVWLALTTGIMQLATVYALGQMQVGYALALFQLSTLISVFLGYRYFKERQIRKRLIGAVIMMAGAILITSKT